MHIVRTIAVFLFASALGAQTFRGSITGVVTDSSGAAIAGAAVSLNSISFGQYTISFLQAGFESRKIDNVEVAVSRTTNLDLQLGVAQQQQVVEVSATAATLETTSTALVGVVNTKTVADLPMNGRDFRQMIKLAPGVSPASTSVNGMRTSGNNYQIDSADNNGAFQTPPPSIGAAYPVSPAHYPSKHRPVLRQSNASAEPAATADPAST
jgi:hypothetical protein